MNTAGQPLLPGVTMTIDGPTTFKYLPQRYPIILLDMVRAYHPAERRLTGLKNVSQNDPFLQGHFPEHPIFPGALIIEALAQASGMLLCLEHFLTNGASPAQVAAGSPGMTPPWDIILADSKIKHTRPVYPGHQMLLETQVTLARGDLCSFKVAATVEGEEITGGQLTLARRAIGAASEPREPTP
jgi:3-hydroxyacyl-[acyl-carrier-protein] dehydratase